MKITPYSPLLEIVQLIGALLLDVLFGSRCTECGDRYRDLYLHEYVDHADLPAPPEPSRFDARDWRAP